MKFVQLKNKIGVAIDGKFEAFYDTWEEAKRHVPNEPVSDPDPVVSFDKPREVPDIPSEVPETVNIDYEVD